MVRPAENTRPSRRIRRVLPWLVALSVALALPLLGAAPSPAATSSTVGTGNEAWYAGPGTSAAPVAVAPVTGLPAANPYRAGTLHVGVAGGTETARTYLRLDASALGDAPLQEATLVLPLDPGDGTLAPETATLTLCFAPDPGPSVDGSLSTPPPVDCSASTDATFEATPTPRFVADLADLGVEPAVRTGGIAVLPSSRAVADKATWHVAFFSKTTAPTPTDAIHADVVLADVATQTDPALPATTPSATAGTDEPEDLELGVDAFEAPLSFTDTPLARLDPPAAAAPPALLARPAVGTASFAPAAATTDGFAYSIVLALPLVLVAAFGALASALSRPPVVTAVVEDHKRA